MSVESIDDKLAHLFPLFAEKVRAILKQATIETEGKCGVDHWIMVEGLRTQARQNYLYAQGRTRPGAIVTHRKVSNHSSGLAADCVPCDMHGNIMWEAPDSIWAQYGHVVRANGLQWGGDYPKLFPPSKFVDQPHCEPGAALFAQWKAPAKAFLKTLEV